MGKKRGVLRMGPNLRALNKGINWKAFWEKGLVKKKSQKG